MKKSIGSTLKGTHDMEENPNFNWRFLTSKLQKLGHYWGNKSIDVDYDTLEFKGLKHFCELEAWCWNPNFDPSSSYRERNIL